MRLPGRSVTQVSRKCHTSVLVLEEGKHNLHQRHADTFHRIVRNFLDSNMTAQEEEISEKEEEPKIDEIAYPFMGKKALFSGLRSGVFDAIHDAVAANESDSSKRPEVSFESIEKRCSVKGERLCTLLSACVALSLVRRRYTTDGLEMFSLPKASAHQLVRSSKRYWGDYISGQVDAQFYSRMADLHDTLESGSTSSHGYDAWFESDPEAAERYTKAQHNGSLATAYALHKRLPELAQERSSLRMLDVGGESGAFSIASCPKHCESRTRHSGARTSIDVGSFGVGSWRLGRSG